MNDTTQNPQNQDPVVSREERARIQLEHRLRAKSRDIDRRAARLAKRTRLMEAA